MNAKRFGKSLLFGAAVGATTYLVGRIIPRVRETWAVAKDAWAATKEDLEEDYELEAETGDAAEKEPTVAETLGDFLGIVPKKARDLLTKDNGSCDTDDSLAKGPEGAADVPIDDAKVYFAWRDRVNARMKKTV